MIVLDALVITKWFKPDEKSPEADYFLQEHMAGRESIFVPTLLVYELTNALWVSRRLTRREIEQALLALFDLRITYVDPNQKLLTDALAISEQTSLSTYDAAYAALAHILGCPLVTADKKLHQRADTLAEIKFI